MAKMTPMEKHEHWLLTGQEVQEDDSGLWWWVLVPAGLIIIALLLDGAQL